jgi:NADH-ubiquinone oxidoreductase chain 1
LPLYIEQWQAEFIDPVNFHDLLSIHIIENLAYTLIIGLKTLIMVFIFIWVRASFPRIRFDQLMSYCWTILLPLVFAFILLFPCILYVYLVLPLNTLFI